MPRRLSGKRIRFGSFWLSPDGSDEDEDGLSVPEVMRWWTGLDGQTRTYSFRETNI